MPHQIYPLVVEKGGRTPRTSYIVIPKLYTSVAVLMTPNFSCSGAIHRAVPTCVSVACLRTVVVKFLIVERPKSARQASPCSSMSMLDYAGSDTGYQGHKRNTYRLKVTVDDGVAVQVP